jgi:hypothetical protein
VGVRWLVVQAKQARSELEVYMVPCMRYMRSDVSSIPTLVSTTLMDLGLVGGTWLARGSHIDSPEPTPAVALTPTKIRCRRALVCAVIWSVNRSKASRQPIT